MAGPSINETHILRPLSNFQISYMAELPNVWNAVAPNIPSQFKADKYAIFPKTYWMRADGAPRAPNTRAVQLDWHMEYGTFVTQNIEAEYPIDDLLRANYDSQLNVDLAGMKRVTSALMKTREKMANAAFMTKGAWGIDYQPNTDGAGYWDSSNSDPIKDVRTLKREITGTTMYEPNFIVLDMDVFDALMDNQSIIYRQVFNKGGYLNEATLAEAFGVQRVFVNKAVIDTTPLPGTNPGFMSSGKFLLGYSSFSPSTTEPTGPACFNWTGYEGAGALGNVTERYRDERIQSDIYRGKFACAFQIVAPELGVFGYNVLSPNSATTPATTPTIGQATSPAGPTASSGSTSAASTPSASSGSTSTGSTSSTSTAPSSSSSSTSAG